MPAHDLLMQSLQQMLVIGGMLCASMLTFGLSLVGIIAYRLAKEEEQQR